MTLQNVGAEVLEDLSDDEAYLFALLSDASGLDLAELTWHEPDNPDGCFRAWPFQWKWWRDESPLQVDQCLAAGTLILTHRGQVPIEEVTVGDLVYTHNDRWRPVTYTWDRGVQPVVTVKGHGHPGLTVTPDHKFWIDKTWKVPATNDRWQTPWRFPSTSVPALPARTYAPGRPSNIPDDITDPGFLWIYGLYVAEGSCSSNKGKAGTVNRVTFSVHEDELEYVEGRLRKVGLRFNSQRVRTERCFNIVVNSLPLATWMSEHGGRGARNMHLAPWVFGLDDLQRMAVLDGMVYGDGHTRGSGRVEYTTTSKALAVDTKLLASSLGYFATMIRYESRTSEIDGRTVHGREGFVVGWYMNGQHNRVKSVTPAGTAHVYDLEVAEDHSFVAESIVVSNCARSVGKTLSITLRMFAFPLVHPGQEAVITAPELVHLEPLTNLIERRLADTRLSREMMPRGRGAVTHRPFMVNFVNGSRIIGRIPQRDGRGVKGCTSSNEAIWTVQGFKRAGDVQVGDLVLTHQGRYMPVTAVHHDVNDCYEVEGQSSFPMVVSCDHRFLGAENLATPKQKRRFADLGFHDVEFLTEHQVYWATPTKFPELPVPPCEGLDLESTYFWWLVGRYLADGWTSTRDRVSWCAPLEKQPALFGAFDAIGRKPWVQHRDHSAGDLLTVGSVTWAGWLDDHFGRLAGGKKLPAWALGLAAEYRHALLDGYLAGDGWFEPKKKRWEVGTASKELAMGVQLLAQSLGYTVNCTSVQPKVTHIAGVELKKQPQVSWRLQIGHGVQVQLEDYLVGKVKNITPVGKQPIVNIVVEGDHSYLSGSIMSHNIHPIWLELDEAQDYSPDGWTELIETLKRGHEGAVWRVHGVTRGIRDKFYEITQEGPENQWSIHRLTALHRPNWTAQEREEKIRMYTSRDHPDYRRNVLGLHGDAQNPLFVLHRLMQCVDDDLESSYNTNEYQHYRITNEMLTDRGGNREVNEFLDFPHQHRQYKNVWIGMDVGVTNHPSEIIVAAAEKPVNNAQTRTKGDEEETRLRALARIHLERISNPQQCSAIAHIMNFYEPRAFSLDKMQPVSEPVLTPSGWARIGALKVGDEVIGSNGKATKVIGVYPQDDRRVMKVTCSDGSWARCGPEHLWTVKNVHQDAPVTVTTEQLARSLDRQKASKSAAARHRPWTIPMLSSPVEFAASSQLPIDPYVLGLLLGDGNLRSHSIRFSSADPEILFELESRLPDGLVLKHEGGYDYTIRTASGWRDTRAANGTYAHTNVLLAELRTLGLAGKLAHEKHVPTSYLMASPADRLAVLQGLMDTDGYVTPCGPNSCTVAIRLSSEQMIDDIITIVESLGGSVRYRTHATSCNGKPGRQAHMATIHLPAHLSPFRLARKKNAVVPRTRKPLNRYIASIEPDGEEESVCIRVEADDHLYVTRHHLLTHNTGLGLPLFQDLQAFNPHVAEQIKGYGFSEKILVDFDEQVLATLGPPELWASPDLDAKEAGIYKNVLEFATDSLRDLVDRKRWWMPWDTDLVGQFSGQTWSWSKEAMDAYGRRRRVYSQGSFHALDACRMLVLGYVQEKIERMMAARKVRDDRPVFDSFVSF